MLDSLEGGERYRQAIYGYDSRGLPLRNLIRHKREYPDPRESTIVGGGLSPFETDGASTDPACFATDDDYELRRARTPVPTFLAEAIETHLSRIYAREVRREGPPQLGAWWADVDGTGAPIDHWLAETVAPLLLALGQLDLLMDHPQAPEGAEIHTQADVKRLGLDRCVASIILPENMLWWRLDESGRRYLECLVRECHETDDGTTFRFRHWTDAESTLYDDDGSMLSVTPHPFGRVPIVRVFDVRKPRCRNIGRSRYEGVAERQREYYNRDSELILSDTTQAHPLLQGPEDFVQADGAIPIGPSWLLPKKKNSNGTTTTYEGFDVVEFPKEGAESIRKNKADIREDVDRDSALVRPTGRDGVPLSGLAKMLDHADGNNRLSRIARVLALAETSAAELALTVLGDGPPHPAVLETVHVVYPTDFDLFTASDVAAATSDFQAILARSGALPETEGLMLGRLMRLCLPGLGDAQYNIVGVGDCRLSRGPGKTPPRRSSRSGRARCGTDRLCGRPSLVGLPEPAVLVFRNFLMNSGFRREGSVRTGHPQHRMGVGPIEPESARTTFPTRRPSPSSRDQIQGILIFPWVVAAVSDPRAVPGSMDCLPARPSMTWIWSWETSEKINYFKYIDLMWNALENLSHDSVSNSVVSLTRWRRNAWYRGRRGSGRTPVGAHQRTGRCHGRREPNRGGHPRKD